jgi:hypothetical protein
MAKKTNKPKIHECEDLPISQNIPPCEIAEPTGKQKEIQDELYRIQKEIYKMAEEFEKKFGGANLYISTETELDYNDPYGEEFYRYRTMANFLFKPVRKKK